MKIVIYVVVQILSRFIESNKRILKYLHFHNFLLTIYTDRTTLTLALNPKNHRFLFLPKPTPKNPPPIPQKHPPNLNKPNRIKHNNLILNLNNNTTLIPYKIFNPNIDINLINILVTWFINIGEY